ncbi:MAG: YqgE/AlgH family protein [Nocardioides sp.]|uniref:YqgE/AlgH family protein n=1 Tax=Nocardioides sp. TaxID=35761 RepID=UPI0039E2257A
MTRTDLGFGQLLVASPRLADPNFVDTVVLLLDTGGEGALGVVLNRPMPAPLPDALALWQDRVSPPVHLFEGGPVETNAALALAWLPERTAPFEGYRPLGGYDANPAGRVGLLDLDTDPADVPPLIGMRIFAGYAGWGSGQLQREVAGGDWDVVPGEPADAFGAEHSRLWRDVLRRQPGDLAWHSTRPADPDLN